MGGMSGVLSVGIKCGTKGQRSVASVYRIPPIFLKSERASLLSTASLAYRSFFPASFLRDVSVLFFLPR